jgi:hypothetical protein
MKIQVSGQTMEDVRNRAKKEYQMLVTSYRYDGSKLERMPSVAIRDSIIEKLVDPSELVRLQLVYPSDSPPDDKWYAAAEMLLGGGLIHDSKKYFVVGSSNSIKKGIVWLGTSGVRDMLHKYFKTSQEAVSYLGVFFSSCIHGITHYDGITGKVVPEGAYGTADGMGFVDPKWLDEHNLPHRQIQVRFIGDDPGKEWIGKGTLLPKELPDGVQFILPESMIKGRGCPLDGRWKCWIGIRDIAKKRQYNSSFSIAQWFSDDVLDDLWPLVEDKLTVIQDALTSRECALKFLGLFKCENEFEDARTTAEAYLQAGLEPTHKWLHNQLLKLMRRAYIQLALGAGIELQGRMSAWADLPDSVICVCDLPSGPILVSRYPVRDPHSLQVVWNENDAVDNALPGTIYVNSNDAQILDSDYDGDYLITCTQESVIDAVSSPNWYPEFRREDEPPKSRLSDPLSVLPFITVKAIGGKIGTFSYSISGALHAGKLEKIAPLSSSLQAEVMGIKWNTRGDVDLLKDDTLQIPTYISDTKTNKDLFVRYAEEVDCDWPLARNYNKVVKHWQKVGTNTSPLIHFRSMVPLWMQPKAIEYVEECEAVRRTYCSWISDILQKVDNPTRDDLSGPIEFLMSWDSSKTTDRKAWAVGMWNVVHGSRSDSSGSAAFYVFTEELIELMLENRNADYSVNIPQQNTNEIPAGRGLVLPLVGALKSAGKDIAAIRTKIQSISYSVRVCTRPNDESSTGFWFGDIYLGQIAKDHILNNYVPSGLDFKAMFIMRGRTVYLTPTFEEWCESSELIV